MLWSRAKYSVTTLSIVSFLESFIFPIPPDLLLVPICISNQKKAFYFSFLATIFSVLGGIVGYLIGAFFSDVFLNSLSWIFDEKSLEVIFEWILQWGILIVLVSGFSPIPYKIFTVASGITGLAFIPFLIASFVGRGTRFFLVGFIISRGGSNLEQRLRKYAEILGWTGVLLLLVYLCRSYLQFL